MLPGVGVQTVKQVPTARIIPKRREGLKKVSMGFVCMVNRSCRLMPRCLCFIEMPGTVVCFTTERKLMQEQFPSPENPDCFLAVLLGDHSRVHEQVNLHFKLRLVRHERFSLFEVLSRLWDGPTEQPVSAAFLERLPLCDIDRCVGQAAVMRARLRGGRRPGCLSS
jgi:hypothetical protein